jgi:hypothetical protein
MTDASNGASKGDRAGTLATARRSLDSACDALDQAVQALPDAFGDNVMASPGLVALLMRVVTARRHLAHVEHGAPKGLQAGALGVGAPGVEPSRWD